MKSSKVYSKLIAAELNGNVYDLSDKVCDNGELKFLNFSDKKG